ncbi:MAG: hypothetical protein PHE55_15645 [Methylococcaceae bacterium]|nr:hypothetical protein [Methylococcaceae bacterium]
MIRLTVMLLLLLTQSVLADPPGLVTPKGTAWWDKREHRSDIQFPHKAHLSILKEEGDSCLLCHTFAKNEVTDPKQLKPLETIANEPLKAVCHNCHVDEKRAPWRCNLCHDDKTRIWPDDHNFNYIQNHAEDGRRNEQACRQCHLDLAFCTDCHFRRDVAGANSYHPLGYRTLHGIEARMTALSCGRCHNAQYCANCHEANR